MDANVGIRAKTIFRSRRCNGPGEPQHFLLSARLRKHRSARCPPRRQHDQSQRTGTTSLAGMDAVRIPRVSRPGGADWKRRVNRQLSNGSANADCRSDGCAQSPPEGPKKRVGFLPRKQRRVFATVPRIRLRSRKFIATKLSLPVRCRTHFRCVLVLRITCNFGQFFAGVVAVGRHFKLRATGVTTLCAISKALFTGEPRRCMSFDSVPVTISFTKQADRRRSQAWT
jgi:hypothetical protein